MKWWPIVFVILLFVVGGDTAVAKQNLTVELFYSAAWHDVTTRVYTRDQITINHGSGNEQTGVVPSDASLTFDNRDGEMNPENRRSSLFGLIGHNTPIRIKVGSDTRFSGQIVSWKPRRAVKGDAWVNVEAQGTVRRLGQGEPPVRSALNRTILNAGPVAYWPLEDAVDSTQAASALGGGAPLLAFGTIPFATVTNVVGSKPLPDMINPSGTPTATLTGPVVMTSTGSWTVQAVLSSTVPQDFFEWTIVEWVEAGITWYLSRTDTDLFLFRNGVQIGVAVFSDPANLNGKRVVQATATQNGAALDWTLKLDTVTKDSGSLAATNVGAIAKVKLYSISATDPLNIGGLGHVAVFNSVHSATSELSAINAWTGEKAGDRFNRLCTEEGITATIVGTAAETQVMGPQYPDTVLNLLEELAKTDAGIIHDTRSQLGLTFRTGRSLYNQ